MSLILASASPRRRQLLVAAGIAVDVMPADVDETRLGNESPEEHVQRLARAKAAAVAAEHPHRVVLGADTVVVMDGKLYGKPADPAEARAYLAGFSGRSHQVLTGVCLRRECPEQEHSWVACSTVHFRRLSPGDIDTYCRLVNTLDKAGAYGIQEHGELLSERVEGLLSTVIGLPVEEVVAALQGF